MHPTIEGRDREVRGKREEERKGREGEKLKECNVGGGEREGEGLVLT